MGSRAPLLSRGVVARLPAPMASLQPPALQPPGGHPHPHRPRPPHVDPARPLRSANLGRAGCIDSQLNPTPHTQSHRRGVHIGEGAQASRRRGPEPAMKTRRRRDALDRWRGHRPRCWRMGRRGSQANGLEGAETVKIATYTYVCSAQHEASAFQSDSLSLANENAMPATGHRPPATGASGSSQKQEK